MRQEGRKAGRQEGRKAGRQEGRKAGRQEGRKAGSLRSQGKQKCRAFSGCTVLTAVALAVNSTVYFVATAVP
jgi:predicted transposase YdaD